MLASTGPMLHDRVATPPPVTDVLQFAWFCISITRRIVQSTVMATVSVANASLARLTFQRGMLQMVEPAVPQANNGPPAATGAASPPFTAGLMVVAAKAVEADCGSDVEDFNVADCSEAETDALVRMAEVVASDALTLAWA